GIGMKEVKGEIYKGFGINKMVNSDRWNLTILTGDYEGYAITSFRKKNTCKLLADALINRCHRTDFSNVDIVNIMAMNKEILKIINA
ncbi:hypothetical protein PJM52_29335, partial [Mycobacterium kansasii]